MRLPKARFVSDQRWLFCMGRQTVTIFSLLQTQHLANTSGTDLINLLCRRESTLLFFRTCSSVSFTVRHYWMRRLRTPKSLEQQEIQLCWCAVLATVFDGRWMCYLHCVWFSQMLSHWDNRFLFLKDALGYRTPLFMSLIGCIFSPKIEIFNSSLSARPSRAELPRASRLVNRRSDVQVLAPARRRQPDVEREVQASENPRAVLAESPQELVEKQKERGNGRAERLESRLPASRADRNELEGRKRKNIEGRFRGTVRSSRCPALRSWTSVARVKLFGLEIDFLCLRDWTNANVGCQCSR